MEDDKFASDRGRYVYVGDKLINEKGQSVMMGWEKPIMEKVANLITQKGGSVLNIGFGMGIIDTYIQNLGPSNHTIIEPHPDVIEYIKSNGWLDKNNVTFVFDKWQNVIETVGKFDGIYLDTWYDDRVPYVKNLIDNCLNVGGVFSMWHNYQEFKDVVDTLDDKYEVSYRYIENNNLIVSAEEQFENGGFYINPNLKKVVIPIVKRIK